LSDPTRSKHVGIKSSNRFTFLRSLFAHHSSQSSRIVSEKMSSQICRSASRAARSLLSSAKNARFFSEGRAIGAASVVHATGKVPQYASNFGKSGSGFVSNSWITGLLALPAAGFTCIMFPINL